VAKRLSFNEFDTARRDASRTTRVHPTTTILQRSAGLLARLSRMRLNHLTERFATEPTSNDT
jgi:hypothetical protein